MESGVTMKTTALVLACTVALAAAAAGYVMAGLPSPDAAPARKSAAPSVNRDGKTDAEFHPNREAKQDRLALAPASIHPGLPAEPPATPADILRSGFDAVNQPTTPLQTYAALPPTLPAPAPPKSPIAHIRNPLLNDAQIASIHKRLKLTAAQEKLWPGVVAALHGVISEHAAKQKQARRGATVSLDPASATVMRLKSAALPLLAQLREDQKREVRMLARIIGLEAALAKL